MGKDKEINRDTRINITLVIALVVAVWQLAEWKGGVNEEIQRLEGRVERLEQSQGLAVPN